MMCETPKSRVDSGNAGKASGHDAGAGRTEEREKLRGSETQQRNGEISAEGNLRGGSSPNPITSECYGKDEADPIGITGEMTLRQRRRYERKVHRMAEHAFDGAEGDLVIDIDESDIAFFSDNPLNGKARPSASPSLGDKKVLSALARYRQEQSAHPSADEAVASSRRRSLAASKSAEISDNPLNAASGNSISVKTHFKANAKLAKHHRAYARRKGKAAGARSTGENAEVLDEAWIADEIGQAGANPLNSVYIGDVGQAVELEVLDTPAEDGYAVLDDNAAPSEQQASADSFVPIEQAFVSALAELSISRQSSVFKNESKLSTAFSLNANGRMYVGYEKAIDKELLEKLTSRKVICEFPGAVRGPLPTEQGKALLEEKMAMLGYSMKRTRREKAAPFIFALIVGTIGLGGMFTSGVVMERFLAATPADALVAEKAPVYGSTFGQPVKTYVDAAGIEHTEYQMKGVLSASGVEEDDLPFVVKVTAVDGEDKKDVNYYEMTPLVESEIGSYEKGTQLTVEIIAAPMRSDGTVYSLGQPVQTIVDSTAMQGQVTLISALSSTDQDIQKSVETSANNYKKLGYDETMVNALSKHILKDVNANIEETESKTIDNAPEVAKKYDAAMNAEQSEANNAG